MDIVSEVHGGSDRRQPRPEPWHLKREINISLIVVLLSQCVVAVWWVSDINAWRGQANAHLDRLDKAVDVGTVRADAIDRELTDRLGRIETMLTNIEKRLDERRMR